MQSALFSRGGGRARATFSGVQPDLTAVAETASPRLDRALADLWPGISRTRWKEYVQAGCVSVSGKTIRDPDAPVPSGARLACTFPALPSAAAPGADLPAAAPADLPELKVLHEDEHLLVLDKQPGVVVHPSCGHDTGTIADALRARYPNLPVPVNGDLARAGIVHRLDMDTSGLLLVAKTVSAQTRLSAAFAAHEVGKQYVALAWGAPVPPSGLVDKPLERARRHRRKIAVAAPGLGRAARTHYETLAAGPVSLLRLKLETGRTHQIRVHLASIAHPVCGDQLYARKHVFPVEFPRQMLHAHTLRLLHPATREPMVFCAPPPADFLQALEAAVPDYDPALLFLPFGE